MAKDLRRDVPGGSDDPSGPRNGRLFRHALGRVGALGVAEDAGHTEVADASDAVLAVEHVLGLEVSVHETRGVCRRQSPCGLKVHSQDRAPGSWFRLQPVGHGAAIDELHHHEEAVLTDADVVHRCEVGMAQLRHRLRLAHEAALPGPGIDPRAHDLDGYRPAEMDVTRGVDDAHGSGTEPTLDFVAVDERGW